MATRASPASLVCSSRNAKCVARFGATSVPGSGVSGAGVSRTDGSGAFDGISWRCRNPLTPPCASTYPTGSDIARMNSSIVG